MARRKERVPRTYHRKDGFVFMADHVTKTVSTPHSVEFEDYPDEIKDLIKNKKYSNQLSII